MTITRGDLKTQVQQRTGDASGAFYGATLYNSVINSRVRTWAGKIASLAPNYYLERTSITGVDDAADSTYEVYNFPSNYRAFVKLERQFGTGAGRLYHTLKTVNAEDQERSRLGNFTLLALPDSISNYEQTVAVLDTQFRLVPAPVNNSYEYQLTYIRKPTDASADESNLDIPDEWQEVVVLDSAIYILSQLGDPTAQGLIKLLDREVKMLKDEFRRKTVHNQGLGPLTSIL